jgi:hypothetical protein
MGEKKREIEGFNIISYVEKQGMRLTQRVALLL